jgi:hypothetical protein
MSCDSLVRGTSLKHTNQFQYFFTANINVGWSNFHKSIDIFLNTFVFQLFFREQIEKIGKQ